MKQFIAVFACAALLVSVAHGAVDCNNPPQSDPDKCCDTPMFFNDTMVLECEKTLKVSVANANADPPAADCVATCLMTNAGNVGSDGSFKREAFENFLIKKAADPSWTPVLKKALDACLTDAVNKAAEFREIAKNKPAGSNCQPRHLFVVDCIYMRSFKNCPTGRWSSNPNCASLKEYVNKCSLIQ